MLAEECMLESPAEIYKEGRTPYVYIIRNG